MAKTRGGYKLVVGSFYKSGGMTLIKIKMEQEGLEGLVLMRCNYVKFERDE